MPALDNPKRERFCREYVIDGNGAQAAIRAGYSAKTAKVQASQLLTIINVQQRVAELRGQVNDKLELTQEKILRDIETISEEARAGGQFSAALKGKELLGRHTGMWPQKIEHKHDLQFLDGMTLDELRAARDFLRPFASGGGEVPGGDRKTH